ncbi:MAG: hypothetical protein NVS3B29_00610 [Candidatus Saccharimonadales bacterium]
MAAKSQNPTLLRLDDIGAVVENLKAAVAFFAAPAGITGTLAEQLN